MSGLSLVFACVCERERKKKRRRKRDRESAGVCTCVLVWLIRLPMGRRQLDILLIKCQDYEDLLRELSTIVDSRTSARIKSMLDKVTTHGRCRPPFSNPICHDIR
jgi:hypothetical protein